MLGYGRFDNPKLLESDKVSEEKKAQLKKQLRALNPFRLRKEIEEKLKVIFALVKLHKNPRKKC